MSLGWVTRRPTTDELRAVSALARELADDPVPELDWSFLERRLEQRIASDRRAEMAVRFDGANLASALRLALASAAIAGLAAFALPNTARRAEPGGPVTVRSTRASASEAELPVRAGELLETGESPAIYRREGNVTLRLGPHTAARVVERGSSLSLALMRGALHADVVPAAAESFAVEVDATRVAAHGTSFDVVRAEGKVRVVVQEGTVAVGPTGSAGATQGWLLVGPSQGSFSLDGARQAWWGQGEGPVPEPPLAAPPAAPSAAKVWTLWTDQTALGDESAPNRAEPSARSPQRARPEIARAAAPAQSLPRPEGAAREPRGGAGSDVQAVLAEIRGCYEHQLASATVEFSVHSRLTLQAALDGSIHEAVFRPPLSPTLMACAQTAIGKARLLAGGQTLTVPVDLVPPAGPSTR